MLNLIYCEFLKLRKSKILLITFLGALVTPLMMFIDGVKIHMEHPEKEITTYAFYHDCLSYFAIAFGLIVTVTIEAYLFSREYSEQTLKTILAIPISKNKLIVSKFITLFIIILVFSLISWTAMGLLAYIFASAFSAAPFNLSVTLEYFIKLLFAGSLLFLTITPFAFLSISSKGYILPIMVSAAIVLANAGLMNEPLGGIFPWTSICFIAENTISQTGYTILSALSLILIVFTIGVASTLIYFNKEDIQ